MPARNQNTSTLLLRKHLSLTQPVDVVSQSVNLHIFAAILDRVQEGESEFTVVRGPPIAMAPLSTLMPFESSICLS